MFPQAAFATRLEALAGARFIVVDVTYPL